MLSHLHWDHAGGATRLAENRRLPAHVSLAPPISSTAWNGKTPPVDYQSWPAAIRPRISSPWPIQASWCWSKAKPRSFPVYGLGRPAAIHVGIRPCCLNLGGEGALFIGDLCPVLAQPAPDVESRPTITIRWKRGSRKPGAAGRGGRQRLVAAVGSRSQCRRQPVGRVTLAANSSLPTPAPSFSSAASLSPGKAESRKCGRRF